MQINSFYGFLLKNWRKQKINKLNMTKQSLQTRPSKLLNIFQGIINKKAFIKSKLKYNNTTERKEKI